MQLGKPKEEINKTKAVVEKLHTAFLRPPLREYRLGYQMTSEDQAAIFVRSIGNTFAHVINGRMRFRTPNDFTMLLMDRELFYLLRELAGKNWIFGVNQVLIQEHLELWGGRHNGKTESQR